MESSVETHDEDRRKPSGDSTQDQNQIEHSSDELPKTYESFIDSFDKPVTIYLTKNGTDQASKVTTTLVEEIARRNGMKVVKNQTQYYLEPDEERRTAELAKTLASTVPASSGADTQFQLRGVVVTVPQSSWSALQSKASTRVLKPIKTLAGPANRTNRVHIFEQKCIPLDLTPMGIKSQPTGLLIKNLPQRPNNTHTLDQQSIPLDLTSIVSQSQPSGLPIPVVSTEMRYDGNNTCPSFGPNSNTLVHMQVSATRTIRPAPRTILPAPVQRHPVPVQPHPAKGQLHPVPTQPQPAQVEPHSAQVQPQPAQVHRHPVPTQPQAAQVQPHPAQIQPHPAQVQPQPPQVQPHPAKLQHQPAQVQRHPDPIQPQVQPHSPQVQLHPAQIQPHPAQVQPQPPQVQPHPAKLQHQPAQVQRHPDPTQPQPAQVQPHSPQVQPQPAQVHSHPVQVQPHLAKVQPQPVQVQPRSPQGQLHVSVPNPEVKCNTVIVNANNGRLYYTKSDIRKTMLDIQPPSTVTGRDYIKVRLQEPINGARWVLLPRFDVHKDSSPPLPRKCPDPSGSPASRTRWLDVTNDAKRPCTSATGITAGQLISSESRKKHYRGCYEGSCICPKRFLPKKNNFYNYFDPNVEFTERKNGGQFPGKTVTTVTPTRNFVGFNLPSVCESPASIKQAADVTNAVKASTVTTAHSPSSSCPALDAAKCEEASSVDGNSSKCPPPPPQQQSPHSALSSCSNDTKVPDGSSDILSDQ